MSKKIFGLGEEVDSPNNFFNANIHRDKVEECKVYGNNGNLIKKISPKEQLKAKWEAMEGNPLAESKHPSGPRKRGQQKKRADLSINLRSVLRTS